MRFLVVGLYLSLAICQWEAMSLTCVDCISPSSLPPSLLRVIHQQENAQELTFMAVFQLLSFPTRFPLETLAPDIALHDVHFGDKSFSLQKILLCPVMAKQPQYAHAFHHFGWKTCLLEKEIWGFVPTLGILHDTVGL